ncbi:MAG TPA: hypothetical protein VKV20_07690 [Ktedonobacteraceae bacterium]|nr:hypothetical protein [Ktedonobacteraceae bacterium]
MERLHTPFLILAMVLIFLAVLIETGTALPGVLRGNQVPLANFQQLPPQVSTAVAHLNSDQQNEVAQLNKQERPPGLGVPYLALVDSIVLFTVALMGIALVLPERLQGRVQGIATLIFSLLLIVTALVLVLLAVGLLILMISLLLAIPFGTIIYLIIYGSFNRAGADIALSLIMLLKFGFATSLFLAQQRFLQSKGLVLLVLTSLLANVLVTFLLGIVPGFLVSITDAISAIIVGVVAIIWGIVLLAGAIISIIKVIQLGPVVQA